jgi:hypothetical protein
MSLIGQEYKQPRVLAHDAVLLTLASNVPSITAAGTGYNNGDAAAGLTATTTTVTGVGTGLTLTVSTNGTGDIIAIEVLQLGSYYKVGDTVTIDNIDATGGGSCTVTITDALLGLVPDTTDIGPNDTTTGSCLYVGGAGNVLVTLESGNTVKFIGVNGGSFLPVMVTHVHTCTAEGASSILALY